MLLIIQLYHQKWKSVSFFCQLKIYTPHTGFCSQLDKWETTELLLVSDHLCFGIFEGHCRNDKLSSWNSGNLCERLCGRLTVSEQSYSLLVWVFLVFSLQTKCCTVYRSCCHYLFHLPYTVALWIPLPTERRYVSYSENTLTASLPKFRVVCYS